MNKAKVQLRFGIIVFMIVLAALSRLLPHPPNFTPIGGMALFGAAYFSKKYWAFLVPLLALWVSDLILNNVVYAAYFDSFQWFGGTFLFVALGFSAIVFFGMYWLKEVKVSRLLVGSFVASLLFFLITNIGAWVLDPADMYPNNAAGLIAAIEMGIPFFWNTLRGDLFFTLVLFGGFELVRRQWLQPQTVQA
ncbi:MAG: DUF6580 family putative transport protein [Bacteroidota bacterium]